MGKGRRLGSIGQTLITTDSLNPKAIRVFAHRVVYLLPRLSCITLPNQIMITSGSNIKIRMAAAGVRSSGAGHEVVFFSNPVPAIGRFEHWVREIDRQLISAVARDVEVVLNALGKHGNIGPGSPHQLHVELEADANPSDRVEDTCNGGGAPANVKRGAPKSGSRPTLQGSLLARGAHWTAAVEAALAGSTPRSLESVRGSRGAVPENSKDGLGILHDSLLRYVDGWSKELREPGIGAYSSVVNGALITQALYQRDVVGDLLKGLYPPSQLGNRDVAKGSMSSISTPSLCGGGQGGGDAKISPPGSFPFIWTCHLRHYSASRAEALTQQKSYLRNRGDGDEGDEGDESAIAPAPPPLMKIGIGPWNVPYGFEYAGTMERLWLTPLSERCLLHAVHSAKVTWPIVNSIVYTYSCILRVSVSIGNTQAESPPKRVYASTVRIARTLVCGVSCQSGPILHMFVLRVPCKGVPRRVACTGVWFEWKRSTLRERRCSSSLFIIRGQ